MKFPIFTEQQIILKIDFKEGYNGFCTVVKPMKILKNHWKFLRMYVQHGKFIRLPLLTKYIVGEEVTPYLDFSYSSVSCSSGIHFFLSKEEAINYKFT